jgi:hypothetical protein
MSLNQSFVTSMCGQDRSAVRLKGMLIIHTRYKKNKVDADNTKYLYC